MATNIQSTQLDFATIKNSLKTYLSQQTEFADYNFEAWSIKHFLMFWLITHTSMVLLQTLL
jgi:hypothetical protein